MVTYRVEKYSYVGHAIIEISDDDTIGLCGDEIDEMIKERATENDMWHEYSYEDRDRLEVLLD